jgi:LPXTG-motif cell wall-anchored protein
MSVRKYVRKNIYRWHRVTSLVVALPILMWSLSGFLHPVMNSFKPEVRNQVLPSASLNPSKIKVSLQQALLANHIRVLHNFKIVQLNTDYFYQVQQINFDSLTYLSCNDGTLLQNGDKLYAAYLAQRYLSEPVTKEKHTSVHHMSADVSSMAMFFNSPKTFSKTRIRSIELIKEFNTEYKSSNVLLPVYRVSFERKDNIRLYIETSTGRLATAVDARKSWFIHFFSVAHTWSFLNGMGHTKNIILGLMSLLCFITSLLGFYVYNILKKKKSSNTGKSWHRILGNAFVLTTALYGFSGAWHAFHKLSENQEKEIIADKSEFSSNDLKFSLADFTTAGEKLTNVSIVRIEAQNYLQLFISKGKEIQKKYIHTKTFTELPDGDIKYGCYLACRFSDKPYHTITHTTCLNQFSNRYSMMNKRLPVIEVGFDQKENYYVETATGHLSAVANVYDKAERFTFSNFHMHHYWEDLFGKEGKTFQKTVLIFSTLGLLLLALTGFWMYWKKRQKSLNRSPS